LDIFQEKVPVFSRVVTCSESKQKLPEILGDRFLQLEIITRALSCPDMLVVNDVPDDPDCQELKRAGIASLVVVPLLNRNRLIGLLSLSTDHNVKFPEEKQGLLQTIASQAALAAENIQNLENKSQLDHEMSKLKSYLLELDIDSGSRGILEQLPFLAKQLL
jgi:GAF domain-containing protein